MKRARPSLRTRFVLACALLVATGAVASFWTLAALSRLRETMAAAVRQSADVTAATARVTGALEREDDAHLLIVAHDAQGPAALARERTRTDRALDALIAISPGAAAPEDLRGAIARYRAAADDAARALAGPDSLLRYHRTVNPQLRGAVAAVGSVRDRHVADSQRAAAMASDEVRRARAIVFAIALAALTISIGVALRLARAVIGPLELLRRGARAIQGGDVAARADVPPGDELGDVAAAFNAMARSLAQFRQSNLDEVLQAKATLEATIEALPDAVVVIDADGAIATLNAEAAALLRDVGVAEPRHARDLAALGVSRQRIDDALSGDVPAAPLVLDAAVPVPRGGAVRHLQPRLLPARGTDEDRARVVLMVSDLTDLARLDAMRAEMIAVASHELRTPVTTLRMTLLMLRDASGELGARGRELVATATAGVEQLIETVDELLDLTRLEAGELRLTCEPVDVAHLARETVARWGVRAGDARVRLEVAIGVGAPPTALADRRRLRAILDNLVDNALKYAPAESAIVVAARALPDARVELAVADEGPGVPADLRERIFDKFFRVEHHRPHGRDARGSGIGLYLCRQLAALHRGAIRCEAGTSGPGARFVVELPAIA